MLDPIFAWTCFWPVASALPVVGAHNHRASPVIDAFDHYRPLIGGRGLYSDRIGSLGESAFPRRFS